MSWNSFLSFTFVPFYFYYFQQVILNVTQALQKYQCHYFFFFFFLVSFPFKANSCQNCGCQNWQLGTFPILAKELIWDMQITLLQKLSNGSQEAQLRLDTSFTTLWRHRIFRSPRNRKQEFKTNVIFTMTLHIVTVCHSTV